MSYIKLNYLTAEQSIAINKIIKGIGAPTEDRVLIMTPNKEDIKVGAIILPQNSEALPRKGVVVAKGNVSDTYQFYKNISIGHIVTYGLYAGKQIEFDPDYFPEDLKPLLKSNTFSVLSLSEILFFEANNSK